MAASKKKKQNLEDQVKEILAEAEAKGVASHYFFKTTLDRYQKQMEILASLEKSIEETGYVVTEHIRGEDVLVANPLLGDYNKAVTATNNTIASLLSIYKTLRKPEETEPTERPKVDVIKSKIGL